MGTRRNTEDRLIALNSITAEADALRSYLADQSSHVVAKAAKIVRDELVRGLEAELRDAFTRFERRPDKDRGCAAKLAVLEALDMVDHDDEAPFRTAARLVQLEPAYERPIDTAGPLRIRGALGLVRLRTRDVLTVLAEHLADEPNVQGGAARALAEHGEPAGAALLRLCVLLGGLDGDVLTDCLCAMLALAKREEEANEDAGSGMEFVRLRLEGPDDIENRAAALALGEMRPDGAFELLKAYYERSTGEDREVARTALELLRSDESREFLKGIEAAES